MLFRLFSLFIFKVSGWKQKGQVPAGIDKCVVVGAPHTSNFDFIYAMAGFYKINFPVRYLIKKEWLNFKPLKRMFLKSGAIAVDRSGNKTMVESLAELLKKSEEKLALLISPEGTRKKTTRWKTGFYYAALEAGVPIVLSHLDYAKKEAVLGPHFMPSGSFKQDMEILVNHYSQVTPRHPDNFSLAICGSDPNEGS